MTPTDHGGGSGLGPHRPTASVIPYGDTAALIDVGDVSRAHAVAAVVEDALGAEPVPVGADGNVDQIVDEIVVGFDSVVVQLRPDPGGHDRALSWLRDLVARTGGGAAPASFDSHGAAVSIPVDFDGPDLSDVASTIATTAAGVVDLLTGADLRVAFVGFSPGFAYLVGLPPALAAVDRLRTPRRSVAAGSVAVAGGFASVYPQPTPGGWRVLGHTPMTLFDPDRAPYAVLRPGDRVRFVAAPPDRTGRADPALPVARAPLAAVGRRWVEVLRPGLLTTVQDGGRRGLAGIGVPRAGPADPESMLLANRLVGNPDGAAALEITVEGPALRFTGPAHVAVVAASEAAADVSVDGRPCRDSVVVPMASGQVLDIGRIRTGVRAYLAVAGGFATPLVVGSRSSDLLSGLGPGALATGDRLDLDVATRPHGLLVPSVADRSGFPPLRVITGPHELGEAAWDHLLGAEWAVGSDSNRVGVRLSGPSPVPGAVDRSIPSTGMVTGAIQVPPDGYPIVLMPDHATVGGYPVIGCVISADLAALGRLGPGDPVRFAPVDLEQALRIAGRRARELDTRVSGWFPTRAGT